jgi:hypothetical protein
MNIRKQLDEIIKVKVPIGRAGDEPIEGDMPRKIVAGAIVVDALNRMNLPQQYIANTLHDLEFTNEEITQVGSLYRAQLED